jgi:hypothetical protein
MVRSKGWPKVVLLQKGAIAHGNEGLVFKTMGVKVLAQCTSPGKTDT